ncbi:restriction endonuclease [Caproiciproducens galactitolivorans]|uniref:Restriction enzyme BgcI subunit beta n=1 Tax=Caproiciproducens galactitolivorans TaxID=642589 RepID=A0A4Z0Y016_9FIRM|nr:restriction endonuclease subunit S [Caproiciproducens galactitolivorans]QEY35504.1 restriction endonuclease [Caproiciproducens galactitolivorans]TGJ77219.1 restriction enzyme BgcI subunit beta [Caproiciproducens galactitolivorans]
MLSLNDREWKTFQLTDIFSIKSTSSSIDKIKLKRIAGHYPYITRTDTNNGINDFVCKQEGYQLDGGNCITIGLDTQTAFYQDNAFYTGQNIQVLRNSKINRYNAKFILPILKNTLSVFNWGGNGATLTRLKRSKILLPITDKGEPDYTFMEQYIKERERQIIQNYIDYIGKNIQIGGALPPLNQKEWREFRICDIFTIGAGKRLTRADMLSGNKPFIGATDNNNGITEFVSNTNVSEDSNVLGVNYNGSVVENFYHPYTCIFSDDVKRFKLKNGQGNAYIYLFLKTMILQQKNKYTYGYKFNEKRMHRQFLLLPIDESGLPDWIYMEEYAKQIYYKIRLEYLQQKALTITA